MKIIFHIIIITVFAWGTPLYIILFKKLQLTISSINIMCYIDQWIAADLWRTLTPAELAALHRPV